MEGFYTKFLTSTPQKYQGQGHPEQEKSEKLSLFGGTGEILTPGCNEVSRIRFWRETGHL